MKTALRIMFAAGSLGAAALLQSCVDPYYGGTTSVTTTTYRPGYEVATLPRGYRTEMIGGVSYYYSEGNYYRPRAGRYVVVEAPRRERYDHVYDSGGYGPGMSGGHYVTVLPRNYRVVNVRGVQYYDAGGTYYQRRGPGYIVVERPMW